MNDWRLLPDGFGGFYFWRSSGLFGGILLIGAVIVIWGIFIAHLLDAIYKDYGGVICAVFIATSILYFLQQLIKKPSKTTILSYFLNYIVAPFFVIYLISASLYQIPDAEQYDFGFVKNLLLLLLIVGAPVIALIGGTIITFIITIIARGIPIKFNSNHKVEG